MKASPYPTARPPQPWSPPLKDSGTEKRRGLWTGKTMVRGPTERARGWLGMGPGLGGHLVTVGWRVTGREREPTPAENLVRGREARVQGLV